MSKNLVWIPVLLAGLAGWVWWGWRIEPENGQIAVLMKKTGKNLPADAILAPGPEYKGIQKDVLPEGRYFRNPWTWEWKYFRAMDIPAGKFGVLVRKFGTNLAAGEIVAKDDGCKGIVPGVLGTGRHRINPYAYDVKLYDDITIKPGHVGVVTHLVGSDIFDGTAAGGFLVKDGMKGVTAQILKEGTHRLNPFIYSVTLVNVQSQRFELSGADAISFLTLDGFTVQAEARSSSTSNSTRWRSSRTKSATWTTSSRRSSCLPRAGSPASRAARSARPSSSSANRGRRSRTRSSST